MFFSRIMFFSVLMMHFIFPDKLPAQAIKGSILSHYAFSSSKPLQLSLPKKLREVSGLTMTPEGHLLAHNDEKGIVYQLNPDNGEILKRFYFGHLVKKGDFEGIACAQGKIYLMTSKGQLIEFDEGMDGESMAYEVFRADLSKKDNAEGLCYDPETESLLLACKDYQGEDSDVYRFIFSFFLKTKQMAEEPRFKIPEKQITDALSIKEFRPSGLERHPLTGTFIIISAQDRAIIEVSKAGALLGQVRLDKERHPQPEGITITADYRILIADEGSKRGTLTSYEYTH